MSLFHAHKRSNEIGSAAEVFIIFYQFITSHSSVANGGGEGLKGLYPPHWLYFYIVLKYLNLNMKIVLQILII
jgi:hypothetical protein